MRRIVITGVESAGKTTLTTALANLLSAGVRWEYAREYLEFHGTECSYEDFIRIARTQIEQDYRSFSSKQQYVLYDTANYVLKIWGEVVYDFCPGLILNEIAKKKFDAYILCAPDFNWIADGLRTLKDEQKRFEIHKMYIEHLQAHDEKYQLVTGSPENRLNQAMDFIRSLD